MWILVVRGHNFLQEGLAGAPVWSLVSRIPFFPLNLNCWALRNAVSKKSLSLPAALFRGRHLVFIAHSLPGLQGLRDCRERAFACAFRGCRGFRGGGGTEFQTQARSHLDLRLQDAA